MVFTMSTEIVNLLDGLTVWLESHTNMLHAVRLWYKLKWEWGKKGAGVNENKYPKKAPRLRGEDKTDGQGDKLAWIWVSSRTWLSRQRELHVQKSSTSEKWRENHCHCHPNQKREGAARASCTLLFKKFHFTLRPIKKCLLNRQGWWGTFGRCVLHFMESHVASGESIDCGGEARVNEGTFSVGICSGPGERCCWLR